MKHLVVLLACLLSITFYAQSNSNDYFTSGNKKGNIKEYTKAIELDSQNASAYNNRGICKLQLGKYNAAIEDFTKAVELKPTYVEAYNYAVLEDYNKIIALNPKNAQAYFNRGTCKHQTHNYDGACSDWKKAESLGHSKAADMISKNCN